MRRGVKGLSGADKDHALKCLLVQDFFSTASNIDLLTPSDADTIKSKVLGAHERNIDSAEAHRIFESAMNVATRLNLAKDYRNTGGNGTGSNTPLLDAFIEKSKNKVRGIKPA